MISMSPKSNELLEVELENAENELRKSAKSLYKNIESSYWELGRILYEVYDGIPGGYRQLIKGDLARSQRTALFAKWGYASFEEWCEREVGILRRSASSLRRAYWWFEIELHLPEKVKDRVKALGRTKVYLLSGFADSENAVSWIEKAENMTYDELKKAVNSSRALNKKPSDKDTAMFEHAAEAEAVQRNTEDGYAVPPEPEHMHTLNTSMYDGQFNTWQAAYDRAKNITGSDKISHNLEMICTDFLATNDFLDPKDDQKRIIAKFEKLTGLKIIAIDPSSGKPIYGADLLWGLVKQRIEFEKEDAKTRQSPHEGGSAGGRAGFVTLTVVPDGDHGDNGGEPPAAF